MGFSTRIPLPKAPAGSVPEGMATVNALNKGFVDAAMEPYTQGANALSKMAYAKLMGPQFMAKMLGNQDILANMPDPQSAIRSVTGAVTGGAPQAQPSLGEQVVNKLKNLFGFGDQPSQPQQVMQQSAPQPTNALYTAPGQGADRGYAYDNQGRNIVASPQEVAQIANRPMSDDYQSPTLPASTRTVAERSAEFKGIKEEGSEAGKIRAQAQKELDDEYGSALAVEKPLNNLIDISQNPVFKNMRSQIPFFQDTQLKYLSKAGTPDQQRVIGNFISSAKNVVAQTAKGFGGRLMAKEFDLADQMKVSDDDTWNTMIGKLESIAPLNQMTKQRTRIASDLMSKEHISKGRALEKADKMVDGQKIRDQVRDRLNPKPSDQDIEYMATKYNISPDEVRKRLKNKGVL